MAGHKYRKNGRKVIGDGVGVGGQESNHKESPRSWWEFVFYSTCMEQSLIKTVP